MDNQNQETKYVTDNIKIPVDLNWKLREEAARRKTNKEQTIVLLLQEALE